MRAAVLGVVVTTLLLAGCKSDGKDSPPETKLTGLDPVVTGSIRPTVSREVSDEALGWFRERGVAAPHGDRLAYCHGFGCEFKTPIPLSPADAAMLGALFERSRASPAQERLAIGVAERWFEKKADSVIGAPPDKRGSDLADAHKPGQTDCIDEATNVTTLLVWLERNGMMRHHTTRRPESRGAFLYAHATAVIRDRITGIDWVADAWMRDSGDPIDVMPLEKWFSLAYVDPTE